MAAPDVEVVSGGDTLVGFTMRSERARSFLTVRLCVTAPALHATFYVDLLSAAHVKITLANAGLVLAGLNG